MIDREFAAYVAGFLDGEGNIQLIRRMNGKRRYVQKAVKITNTNEAILREIQSVFGGSIRSDPTGRLRRLVFKLEITRTSEIQLMLRALLPYLRLKREQAEILLQFLQREKWAKSTPAEHELCARMVALNRQSRWAA